MINIIGAIVGGLLVGILARWLYPGNVPMSGLGTILLGIGGALIAGYSAHGAAAARWVRASTAWAASPRCWVRCC